MITNMNGHEGYSMDVPINAPIMVLGQHKPTMPTYDDMDGRIIVWVQI